MCVAVTGVTLFVVQIVRRKAQLIVDVLVKLNAAHDGPSLRDRVSLEQGQMLYGFWLSWSSLVSRRNNICVGFDAGDIGGS